ncbi:hypothetical protein BGX33_004841 [Mortierella sp. NVP41]|nr:hypothetical protein BGX33_004841 [Mortierella sp. NVP41]
MFTDQIMRKLSDLTEKELAFIEGEEFVRMCPVGRMHPACLRYFVNETYVLQCFYKIILYRETIWTLAAPVLDQLESLTIPLSDTHRYHGVIDSLGRLGPIQFILDELFDNGIELNEGQVDEPTQLRKAEAMRAMVQFVEDHARRFQGRLKTVDCPDRSRGWYDQI